MSLAVALQSVLYYVLSCQPCRNAAHERRRARQAALDNQEKTRMATDQPHHYSHPAPFSTNIYWQEEISFGPGPPPQRLTRAERKRKLNGQAPGSSGYVSPEGMHTPTEEITGGNNLHRERYHREDEPLWGRDIYRDTRDEGGASPEHRALSGSSVGLPGAERSGKEAIFHYTRRNPPVNEYHPPVVSAPPLHRSETFWMLQPPPSPSVMAGKVPASRSQSSVGRRKLEDIGRHAIEKSVVEKALLGESPSPEPDLQYMYRRRAGQNGEDQSHCGRLQNGGLQNREPSVAFPSGGSVEGRRKQKRRSAQIEISEDSRVSDGDPIQLPRPIFMPPSPTPQRLHLKRHSYSSALDSKNPPAIHDTFALSSRRPQLLLRFPERSPSSVESYSTAPEAPLSPTVPATEHASQILQEIGSPNYTLTSRPMSPHLAEPRAPSPIAVTARRETLFRNEIRPPLLEPRSEGRGSKNGTPTEGPLKSNRGIIGGSVDSVNMCPTAEAHRLSLTIDGLTMLF